MEPPGPIQINRSLIGPGCAVYLIAEAGVNHNGCLDTALKLVDAAGQAGADAVKFQAFKASRLASRHAQQAAYQKNAAAAPSQAEMLARLELSPQDFARIREHCDDVGIEFLATPFSPEDIRVLLDIGIRALKIASPDIVNKPLLQAAAASHLPIILSTGASEVGEIDRAHDFLTHEYQSPLVLLHCVSSYPTKLEDANVPRVTALYERYVCPVGFSDHTAETLTAELAIQAGAHVLEKHFTLDRTQPGPDHAFSLSPTELADYITRAHRASPPTPAVSPRDSSPPPSWPSSPAHLFTCSPTLAAKRRHRLSCSPAELEVRKVSRCSVTAACDIPAGATLTSDMLAIKRPGTGITPWDLERVLTHKARYDISADTPIQWEMLI